MISVLIADDHPVVRQGISVLLSVHEDMAVAGEAADGEQTLLLAAELKPDVLLLDLKLPGLDGLAVLGQLPERSPATRALVLTSAADRSAVSLALRAGAAGLPVQGRGPRRARPRDPVRARRAHARGRGGRRRPVGAAVPGAACPR